MKSTPAPNSVYTLQNNRRAALEMIAAAFAFATMACIAHAFRDRAPWPLVPFARILITLVISLFMLARYDVPLVIRGTPALWGRSVFGSLGLLSTFYCLTHLPITDTVTIFATSPIWIALILTVFFKEPIGKGVWAYALLALVGVYVLKRPTFDAESFPLAVALFGAIVVSCAKVSLGRCGNVHPLSVVLHYSTFATLVSGALFIGTLQLSATFAVPMSLWIWLIPMGLAGTVAQVFMTLAYGRGNTTMVALVGISQIGFSVAYDVVVWDQTFDIWKVVGILVVATAIALCILSTQSERALAQPQAEA